MKYVTITATITIKENGQTEEIAYVSSTDIVLDNRAWKHRAVLQLASETKIALAEVLETFNAEQRANQ